VSLVGGGVKFEKSLRPKVRDSKWGREGTEICTTGEKMDVPFRGRYPKAKKKRASGSHFWKPLSREKPLTTDQRQHRECLTRKRGKQPSKR